MRSRFSTSLAKRTTFDSPLIQLAPNDPLHKYARSHDVVRIELARLDELFHFGDRYLRRRSHHRIKIARRLAIHQVAHAVPAPRLHEREIRGERLLQNV